MTAQAWVFPGQGAQHQGMGRDLFDRFRQQVAIADGILGYSVEELCLADPGGQLRQTQYAQPALFVVNALTYLDRIAAGRPPSFLAGHSLGEYNALFAAGSFDFGTGLRLVKRRGELMAAAGGGAMAAVIGPDHEEVAVLLARLAAGELDVASYNGPAQTVISGPREAISAFGQTLRTVPGARLVPLNVSAAFHSRYMAPAAAAFGEFVRACELSPPRIPVIANVTARPYPEDPEDPASLADLLVRQLTEPVRWWETMSYLAGQEVTELAALGPGQVLTELWKAVPKQVRPGPRPDTFPRSPAAGRPAPERLGSQAFREAYGVRYAYLAGSMYHGVSSAESVVAMGKAGLMGFFGTGGLPLPAIEESILTIKDALGPDGGYGMNLLHAVGDPELEDATVAMFLRHGVRYVEAAGFTHITPALVRFRCSGAHRDGRGQASAVRHVLAKVSRPEVAAAFMRPPPDGILGRLVAAGQLTPAEAEVARMLPISDDLCVESDSGGHTDAGVALTLVPSMARLRDEIAAAHGYPDRIRVGAAGGLGAPEALAAAFVLGADFVVTGSVNQCSPEAGTSADVKDMLAGIDVQDTAYAPAGDMFEVGARVQVLRKGTLFPARSNKLYQLYRACSSLADIDQGTRRTIEQTYFKASFAEVWQQVTSHYAEVRPAELERAERDPRHQLALTFRWYFARTTQLALRGVSAERVNYQVHCGPAVGAFNRFVRGTDLEDWRYRHVDVIAELLMERASAVLGERLRSLSG